VRLSPSGIAVRSTTPDHDSGMSIREGASSVAPGVVELVGAEAEPLVHAMRANRLHTAIEAAIEKSDALVCMADALCFRSNCGMIAPVFSEL
jgi:hypothetical protein